MKIRTVISAGSRWKRLFWLLPAAALLFSGCAMEETAWESLPAIEQETDGQLPDYTGEPYVEIDENTPDFTAAQLTVSDLKEFQDLDSLGRCTGAIICAGPETLPTGGREDISAIHPTGWVQNRYSFVEQEALYNRSHLIAWSICGENANEKNLITGTRYLNAYAMEPFESRIVEYIEETGNHVLYQVVPAFEEDNLLASGVFMQAESIEDDGEGISFHIYCFNVQPGITIEYDTGNNEESAVTGEKEEFILNTSRRTYHDPDCANAQTISSRNQQDYYGTEQILQAQGYTPASDCIHE